MVEVRSRSDKRRSNKRQSLILIAFIVTVGIVCYASGYMVGRNSGEQAAASQPVSAAPRKPIAKQEPAKQEPEKTDTEKLTFYESLPKGEQTPLGSGINLPAEKEAPVTAKVEQAAQEVAKPAIPEKVFEAKVEKPAVKPAPKTASKPAVDAENVKYILQVASYPKPVEAGQLLGKLTQGGYDVYMQETDLGSKGVWYRVYVGPITGKNSAEKLKSKLEREFRVKPLVHKQ